MITLSSRMFSTLAQLREWLNEIERVDLNDVYPHEADYFVVDFNQKTLTDGSNVYSVNITLSMGKFKSKP